MSQELKREDVITISEVGEYMGKLAQDAGTKGYKFPIYIVAIGTNGTISNSVFYENNESEVIHGSGESWFTIPVTFTVKGSCGNATTTQVGQHKGLKSVTLQ